MKIPAILLAVQPVIQAFEKLSIPYHIGGSIASSVYGMARATLDVDIVADHLRQIIGIDIELCFRNRVDITVIHDHAVGIFTGMRYTEGLPGIFNISLGNLGYIICHI